ncbi:MAG: xanthine dehydrogenase family protein subunit M [Deinococcus sp.]|nr:xanthine dehydrogenase family protein subunit M [Deinococcus sp.]
MKAFEYRAPRSLSEAVALLAEKGEKARPLAGGTDLIVQLRGGRLDLDFVVDIKWIPELNQLSYDPASGLTIGAAVPCYRIYEDPVIRRVYPGLVDAASIIGGIGIQGRATWGGNLCNSSPSGDTIPALMVLGATCTIAGPNGTRTVPVEQFCTAPGRNVLRRGEMLVSFHIPVPLPHSGAYYLRFIPRNEMDIAVVGAGASVVLSNDLSTITAARIALGAVAPTPLLAESAGNALIGKRISDETIAEAARLAQQAARPITDMRGTIAQRRHLVGVLTKRALHGAIERAQKGASHAH